MMSACVLFNVCCVLGRAKNGLQKWSVLDVFRTAKVVAATQENASVQLFCELYTAPVHHREHQRDRHY